MDAAKFELHPAYFGLVMATGIVSIAAEQMGLRWIGSALFGLNIICYAILWLLMVARLVFSPNAVLADFSDHNRCVGFFTAVAASGILANQFLLFRGDARTATALFVLACVLLLLLNYALFATLTLKHSKPQLGQGINGGWLLPVVAAQSLAVLGAQLAESFAPLQEITLFFSLAMWLVGDMLYLWIITLIFYRFVFFPMGAAELTPPYWINMGSVAISTLAGTTLIEHAQSSVLLLELLPFLKGFTLLFWAVATWWIPLLLLLMLWRHAVKRFPLTYDPLYWGMVFPFGMYTVCTNQLALVLDTPFLRAIPEATVYVALLAWAVTFFGLAKHLLAKCARAAPARPPPRAQRTDSGVPSAVGGQAEHGR